MHSAALSLLRLLGTPGPHTAETLARVLGLSPQEIEECALALREQSIDVQAPGVSGQYALARPVDLLDVTTVNEALRMHGVPFALHFVECCDSTNAVLRARARTQSIHGQALVCELQTAGRGRRGRVWHTGLGDSLAFSVGWRFTQPAHTLGGLSLAVAIACAQALETLGAAGIRLKWPNDLLCEGGKLGGILIEVARADAMHTEVVIGIGLNMQASPQRTLQSDRPVADLAAVLPGEWPGRNMVLSQLLKPLAAAVDLYAQAGFVAFEEEWRRRHAYEGQRVRLLIEHQNAIEGQVAGVAADGALLLQTDHGVRPYHAGDVSLREVA